MAQLMFKRLPAATLIEVLIAMVIIMVVFTLSIKVFNNVMASGGSYKKLDVHCQLSRLAQQAQQKGSVANEMLAIDSVQYLYTIHSGPLPEVSVLEIKAIENGKQLGTVKCLLKNNKIDED